MHDRSTDRPTDLVRRPVQDFYHESICLLMFRIGGDQHPYMSSCACDAETGEPVAVEGGGVHDLHIDHNGARHHRQSFLNLDKITAAKVDRLSVVDRYDCQTRLINRVCRTNAGAHAT